MRKFTVIPLLLLMVIGQAGYNFIFYYQQHKARKEARALIRSNLPESSLFVIETHPGDPVIRWKEAGKEFYFKGELFDVVKIKKFQGKLLIYGISDHKEKELLAGYAKIAGSQSDNNGKPGKSAFKFQLPDFIISMESYMPVFNSKRTVPNYTFDSPLLTATRPIQAPPPKG